ncbi:LTA synthase family protein [Segetibacter sp. 3557_3]|uniref:LTA synthase family protein n=1 Tax=Segetibacter sp. 3557_3 TaxID=2547429 RepID=UPI0014051E9D|nr:LTA synthase family protein [Segetibacter sp. 3557_3]
MPKTIQWTVKLFFIFLLIFTLFRLSTYLAFRPEGLNFFEIFPSFLLGCLFDIRWICIILLPVLCSGFIPNFTPYSSISARRFWTSYLSLSTFIMMFFFGADYGHFAYVSTRLNASALNFVEDAKISMEMLWQSYPLLWISLALIAVVYLFYWLYRRAHIRIEKENSVQEIQYRTRWYFFTLVLFLFGIYGSFTTRPLVWKDAFVFKDNFKSYLALNPLQNFATTLRFRKPVVDDERAKDNFPIIRDYLQLDSTTASLNFRRLTLPDSRGLESKPNIVLVICESFSMYKSTMSGNPLNTTPYFDQLSKEGIFFSRCFSPHFATARGVFATLTGIPDVQLSKFSSRNEESLQQHTIINNFEDYSKFYFMGGSSEFNNLKRLLNNIKDLRLYEEGSYTSPKVNVWGISDKNLFKEATKTLSEQKNPFFAVIQTSDNHRPFTIPVEDSDFVKRDVPKDTLEKYGFLSIDEFHAFCYTDFAFKSFIEDAKKESWFDNTIFVFVGDHGVAGDATAIYPDAWTDQRLGDEHIPLLLYAPKLLVPARRDEVVSQIDVLPTIAGLVHNPYVNTTLGRDLLNPAKKNNVAFIIHHDEGRIGIVTDSFYYTKNIRFEQETLLPVKSNIPWWNKEEEVLIKKRSSSLTSALYETAKWMLVNNKK